MEHMVKFSKSNLEFLINPGVVPAGEKKKKMSRDVRAELGN